MSIALVNQAGIAGTGSDSVTTSGADTTGATLLVAALETVSDSSPTISDSFGNTWTKSSTAKGTYGPVIVQFYYCYPPSNKVGAGHTFTISSSQSSIAIYAMAFSGISGVTPENGKGSTSNSGNYAVDSGTITPSGNGALVISAGMLCGAGPMQIPSGWTGNYAVAGTYGCSLGMAYIIDATPSATNAHWTCTANNGGYGVSCIFDIVPPAPATFTASPGTIPAGHSGNITLTLTGSNTAWVSGTTFSIAGVTGAAIVSQSVNTGAQTATLVITTGSGTGTLTISDSTDSATATVTVATATLAVSPTSGPTGQALTLTGTNTLWSTDISAGNYTAANLFSVSGSGSPSLGSVTSITTTGASTSITFTGAPTLTITDNSTGATATFTSTAPTFTASPAAIPAGHAQPITITLTGSQTSWSSGSTVTITNSLTGTTAVMKGTWNAISATSATLTVTTGAGAGTWRLTIDGINVTTSLSTVAATLSLSTISGAIGTAATLTLTGGNTLWSTDIAAGNYTTSTLFSVSGGSGAGLGVATVTTNTAGTVTLTIGSGSGALTITDNSTGATATFTATSVLSTCSPTTIPANHPGPITLTFLGANTTWSGGSTVTVTNSLTGTTTVTKGTWTRTSATAGTLTVTTGAGAGTFKVTIDGVDCSTTLNTAVATLAISPNSANAGATPSLTLSGTNTLWASETAAGLFTVTGGTGSSIATPTGITNTAATAVLTVGSTTGILTVHDTSTGATATFTATPLTALTAGTASLPGLTGTLTSTNTITVANTFAGTEILQIQWPGGTCLCSIASHNTSQVVVTPISGDVLPTSGTVLIPVLQPTTTQITVTSTAATAGTGTYTYSWQRSTDANAWTTLSLANSLTFTDTPPAQALPYAYRLQISDAQNTVYTNVIWAALAKATIRIGWIGDSIWGEVDHSNNSTSTRKVPDAVASNLAALYGPRNVICANAAVPGSATNSWLPGSPYYNEAIAMFAATGGVNYVMIMLGTNDATGSVSQATYQSNLSSTCAALVAAGMKVILNYPGGCFAGHDAYMSGYWAAINALVDNVNIFQGDTEFPAWFADQRAQFPNYQVHPDIDGQNSLAMLHTMAVSKVIDGTTTGGTTGGGTTTTTLTPQAIRNAMALPLSQGVVPAAGSVDSAGMLAAVRALYPGGLLATGAINGSFIPYATLPDGSPYFSAGFYALWTDSANGGIAVISSQAGVYGSAWWTNSAGTGSYVGDYQPQGTASGTVIVAAGVSPGIQASVAAAGGGGTAVNITTQDIVIRSDS